MVLPVGFWDGEEKSRALTKKKKKKSLKDDFNRLLAPFSTSCPNTSFCSDVCVF